MSSEVFAFVPSYNHAPFIEKCLTSIIDQTLAPTKLLVIDDGSNDDSPAIIEKVLNRCPFDAELKVRENRGLCRTLNEAFSLSSGEYFAYIGSDDFWLPEFLESRSRLLDERATAVLGYGHASLVDPDGKVFDSTAAHTDDWANYPDGNARSMLLAGMAPISSTVFYRRTALEEVKWNEGSRLEDYEMYLNLMNRGDFAFDPQILSAWRLHDYNTSGDRILMLDEVIKAQNRNFDELGVDEKELEAIQSRTKFRYARMELQHGNKSAALRLARESWRGSASIGELSKFAIRMMVPMTIVEARRKARRIRRTTNASVNE